MGRPINKKFIGHPVTKDGHQIYIDANIGQGIERCFIVKQRSTRRFLVQSLDSGNQLTIRLVDDPALVETTPGLGVIEIGSFDSNFRIDEINIVTPGSGYSVNDVLQPVVAAGGTPAAIDVDSVSPVDGDETIHIFSTGGTNHAINDVITISDGSTVTVDAVTSGVVTEFTLNSSTATIGLTSDSVVLSQTSSTGSGTGFALTTLVTAQKLFSVSIQDAGSYDADVAGTVGHTGGTGTGATFELTTRPDHNEYVSKLHNKSARIHGVGLKETFSVNKSIPGTDRNIHGE